MKIFTPQIYYVPLYAVRVSSFKVVWDSWIPVVKKY